VKDSASHVTMTEIGMEEHLRTRQFQQVLHQVPLHNVANLLTLMAAQALPWGEASGQALRWGWSAGLLAILSGLTALWWRWRRKPQVPPWPVRAMATLMGLSGLLYGLATVHLLDILTPAQGMLVIGVGAAYLAAGSVVFVGLRSVALAWTLSNGMCLVLGMSQSSFEGGSLVTALTGAYALLMAEMVLRLNRVNREHLVQQHQIEHQRALLDLALRDFESDASDWLWELDRQGHLRHASVHLAAALGRPAKDLLGLRLDTLLQELSVDTGARSHLQHQLGHPKAFSGVLLPWLHEGKRQWWQLKARPLLDAEGVWVGWRGVAANVTAVQLRDEALLHLAEVDSLTGLASRHRFQEQLHRHWPAEGLTQPCTLVLIDLDNFKNVNDTLGHAAGDQLLHEVARRLQQQVSEPHLLARLGGDEFALLMPGRIDPAHLEAQAQALQQALESPVYLLEHALMVHMSLGTASAPEHAQTAALLMQRADLALYAAKAAGRDQMVRFAPYMEEAAQQQLRLGADLREALAWDQLQTAYQPKFDLKTGALVGVECLARWHPCIRGPVSPAQFIALAEETGLIVELGQQMLVSACASAASWDLPLPIAVNVSAVQIERCDVAALVAKALADTGLAPERLEIELTESIFLGDSPRAHALVGQLKRLGVGVALDDFGTGYSSLGALQRLSLDTLKIDRSFVQNLDPRTPDAKASAIVRTVLQLAQAIGARTIAEGIETQAQHSALLALGCDIGQGFWFGRPMSAHELRGLLERQQHQNQNRTEKAVALR
jgi:diguanylate cyclase (GGDEF)-like protein